MEALEVDALVISVNEKTQIQAVYRAFHSNNHEALLSFLKGMYREHPGHHLHVIVDNLFVLKHRKVRGWIKKRRRLTLHFTPIYASWLNPVEVCFNIFSRDVLRGGIWKPKKELVDRILLYFRKYNKERERPFKWAYMGQVEVYGKAIDRLIV
ncbi:MAG: transposase [Leptospirales bacterium]